jgi:hypothetical protein
MNKFTPGPWHICAEMPDVICCKDDYVIAEHVEVAADAHLIAAAPDLLEALESLLEYAESGWDHFPCVSVSARAAINKAKGGNNG